MIGHVVQDCVRPTHPVPFNPVIPVKAAQHKTAQTRQLHRCTVLGINGTNATLHLPTAQMFHGDWILFCNVKLRKRIWGVNTTTN